MNAPIQPLRYELPRDVDWSQLICLLRTHGYSLTEIGRAMGSTASDPSYTVTRYIEGHRRAPYATGVALLALAEDTLSERELSGCVTGAGYHPHCRPPRRDAGHVVRYPTEVDTHGLVSALMDRGIDQAQIARAIDTAASTLTRAVKRGGLMSTGNTLRLLEYAHRVLPASEFESHVAFAGESA